MIGGPAGDGIGANPRHVACKPACVRCPPHEHPHSRCRPCRRKRCREPGLGGQRHHRHRHRSGAPGDAAGPARPERRGRQRHPAVGAARGRHRGRRPVHRLRAAGRDQPRRLQGGAPDVQRADDDRAHPQPRVPGRCGADDGARRLCGRSGDLPRRLGDAHDAQADRVPRGAAGAGVRRRPAEPGGGARGGRRAAGAAQPGRDSAARAGRRHAHRRHLPPGQADRAS